MTQDIYGYTYTPRKVKGTEAKVELIGKGICNAYAAAFSLFTVYQIKGTKIDYRKFYNVLQRKDVIPPLFTLYMGLVNRYLLFSRKNFQLSYQDYIAGFREREFLMAGYEYSFEDALDAIILKEF